MALSRWNTALRKVANGVSNATVLCIGDSLTAGNDSTGGGMGSNARTASYPVVLAENFLSVPASADGWFGENNCDGAGASMNAFDSRVVLGAGWTITTNNTTVGRYAISQQSGNLNAMTFTPGVEFDRIRIYYACWDTSPEYTVNIGGATIATLNMDQDAYNGTAFEDITCTLGTNPVNIVATGDWGSINGCYVYKSSVKQVTVINGGWWGAYSADYAANANGWQPLATIKKIAPDLSIICLGGNDCIFAIAQATFKANLGAVIDAALVSGDVLLVGFTRVNPTTVADATQTTYLKYISDVAAEKNVPFFDPTTRANWNNFTAANAAGFKAADGIHNTGTGYADLAEGIREFLDFQLAGPVSDVSAGAWVPSSGASLAAMIGETAANDASNISTGTPSTCEETLDTIEDPGVDTGFSFTYRLSATTGGFVVSLKQGATTIASWTHGPGGPATFERAITPAEAATITYPATLTLRIEATA